MTTATDPVATTTQGKLRGTTEGDGIFVFRGIPYGASTAGSGRFRPPQPAEAWTGERDATEFGPICPQQGPLVSGESQFMGGSPRLPLSEDCLVLNVWTPAADDGGKRPVMVWLHGRGFTAGAGSEDLYNGANLARRGDAVIVTINHRLNIFGALHLADIGSSDFAGSGVVGMLDAVLALEWVRDNIEQFGGDPGNVTIFGESGGGRKVCTLLAMPSAEGLFHRAIIQSSVTLRAIEADAATEYAERLLAHLGIGSDELHKLQQLPFQELIDATNELTGGTGGTMPHAPVVDGDYFPVHPFDAVPTPTATKVPVIVGTNRDENALFVARDPQRVGFDEDQLLERLDPLLGDRRDEILATYREQRSDDSPWDLYVGITSESRRLAATKLAERISAAGGEVFMYLFTWESDFRDGVLKASHAMEIPFVFDNVDVAPMTGERPDRSDLAESISETWLAFARNGDPDREGAPHWPTYDAETRSTMILDVPTRIEDDPAAAERTVWGDLDIYR
ncbi:MAG TPA: carboxylesterase/lipase family protein [Dehalococcoidia bacterium]|nr:carboxylesterase/lipase family protein [Dehalococcoidia bacterium]